MGIVVVGSLGRECRRQTCGGDHRNMAANQFRRQRR
jgi:hypothetical protein